jgi:hypothetical protein
MRVLRGPWAFWIYAALWILMMALRQDPWFSRDPRLVFGAVPISLAYQAGFSILAALVMAVLVRVAWPEELERLEEPQQRASGRE